MKKKCLYCECEFKAARPYAKYCSSRCRYRAAQDRSGKTAKTIICVSCGCDFKRRSANNIFCLDCVDKMKIEKEIRRDFVNYPKTSREDELKMIQEYLDKQNN